MQSKLFDAYLEDVIDFQDRAQKEKQVTEVYRNIHAIDFNDQGKEVIFSNF